MKNKKLFAILTLVCFMFTLMPVAAFAAPTTNVEAINSDHFAEVVNPTVSATAGNLIIQVTSPAFANYYVVAFADGDYKTGTFYKTLGVTTHAAAEYDLNGTTVQAITATIQHPGTYYVYVVENDADAGTIMGKTLLAAEKAAQLAANADIKMLDNVVTVTGVQTNYYLDITGIDTPLYADNGYSKDKITVELKAGVTSGSAVAVPGVKLNVYSDSYGLQVTPVDEKTNAAGKMEFLLTGTIAGDFHVYAEYAGTTTPGKNVKVNSVGAVDIEVTKAPQAPINRTTALGATGIVFNFLDKVGAKVTSPASYQVTLVAAPAGVNKNITDLRLDDQRRDPDVLGYVLKSAQMPTLAVNGDYTFKVSMQNGASATATVTVKDFGKMTSIKFVDMPKTVAYNSAITGYDVYAVDANGVTKKLNFPGEYTVSANGIAVNNVTGSAIVLKGDDDHIGKTVTVLAKANNGVNALIATAEVAVVDVAGTVEYVTTEAEVGVNTKLNAVIKDAAGLPVALSTPGAVTIIVLEKPENAVASATSAGVARDKSGFQVDFLASAAGEYKIQTVVTYGDNYVSGIETITVGGGSTAYEDVIVMSIGANSLVKNSEVVAMPAAPEIKDMRTMVPARAGLEAFGATVVWDEATQTVTAEMNGVKVVMEIGEKEYTVNGKTVVGDAAPYITSSSTMVPVSFFTNAFGITATPIYDDHGVCDVLFTK